ALPAGLSAAAALSPLAGGRRWSHNGGAYRIFLDSGLATSRACSMKSRVAGLSVRFLRWRIPMGTGASGNTTGRTLSCGRTEGKVNLDLDVETIERKRPVARRLMRASEARADTVALG